MDKNGNDENKRTTVSGIIKSLSDTALSACVLEAKAWHRTGLLPGANLIKVAEQLQREANIDEDSSLAQTEAAVLWEASLRFAALHPPG